MTGLGSASFAEQLVPGSVEAAYEVSHLAQRRGKVADEVGDDLRRRLAIEGWTGEGADAYAARMTAVAQRWIEIGQGAAAVVEPMRTYALALRRAQGLAAAAIEAWSYAATLPEDAAAAAGTFTSFAHGWPVLITDPRHQGAAPVTKAEARARAEAMLADARADVATAGSIAARAVRAAIEKVRARGDVWACVGAGLGATSVTAESVLAVMQSLDTRALTALLRARPDLITRLKQTTPEEVAPWWRRLSVEQQNVLIAEAPGVIGNLGGVAYAARDRANRIVLAEALEVSRHIGSGESDQVRALEAVERASSGNTLVSLVLDHPPLAQVAVGDLDRAKHVSVIVPGMGTTVENSLEQYVFAAGKLRVAEAQAGSLPLSDVSVVAWIGYHPPMPEPIFNATEVMIDERAAVGSRSLAGDLQSLTAAHAASGEPVDLSVIAHSYGTDVATLAVERAPVEHLVLLGSAGVSDEVSNVTDLRVPAGEVYASQSTKDGWAPVGQGLSSRADPTSPDFGARPFSSERVVVDGDKTLAVGMHGPFAVGDGKASYLDFNSSALRSTAMISVGRGSELPEVGTPEDRFRWRVEAEMRKVHR